MNHVSMNEAVDNPDFIILPPNNESRRGTAIIHQSNDAEYRVLASLILHGAPTEAQTSIYWLLLSPSCIPALPIST